MRTLGSIAWLTFQETRRLPTSWLITLAAAFLILILPLIILFGLGQEQALLKEMGLATIVIATVLVALLCATTTITRELEGQTLLTLLAKPVARSHVVIGKFLGVLATVTLITLILTAILHLSLTILHGTYGPRGSSIWASAKHQVYTARKDARRAELLATVPVERREHPDVLARIQEQVDEEFDTTVADLTTISYGIWRVTERELPGILLGAFLAWWKTAIIAAVLVAGSTCLAPAANAVLALLVFTAGHLMDILESSLAASPWLLRPLQVMVPNLRLFDIGDAFIRDMPLPFELAIWATGIGAAYVAVALSIGCILLHRRDIG